MHSFTASEAKIQFGELISRAMREPVSITKNGRPTVVVMAYEDYAEIVTFKLQHLRAILARSVAQAERGELHDIDDVFNELTADEIAQAATKGATCRYVLPLNQKHGSAKYVLISIILMFFFLFQASFPD